MKQVIVVRTDLSMSEGKIGAQTAHASQHALSSTTDDKILRLWKRKGSPKIVLAAEGKEALENIQRDAQQRNLPTALITDDGRTEIPSGTTTALGIGPAKTETIDQVTGDLSPL